MKIFLLFTLLLFVNALQNYLDLKMDLLPQVKEGLPVLNDGRIKTIHFNIFLLLNFNTTQFLI